MGKSPNTEAPCALCGGRERELVYGRSFDSAVHGRVEMQLGLCACGFLESTPRPDPAERARSGSERPYFTWRGRGKGSRAARALRERADFVANLLPDDAAPGRLLDVGAGNGDFLQALGLPGWDHEALEPDPQAASRARSRDLVLHETTLEEHGLEPDAYDLVTCFGVLERVPEPNLAMEALATLLKPGGTLVLGVPDAVRPVRALSEFYALEHLSHFTAGTLVAFARKHGFVLEELHRTDEPGLLAGFRNVGTAAAAATPAPGNDRAELHAAVLSYREEREAIESLLAERFRQRIAEWQDNGNRVALLGAGEHTHFLLDLVDFGDSVVGILDSDPAKHGKPFRRWKICSPFEAPMIGADTVIVSSKPFQEEMAAALAPLARQHGIEIVRCYPEAEDSAASAA